MIRQAAFELLLGPFTGQFLMRFITFIKAVHIHLHIVLGSNFFCKLQREAIGIVQMESRFAINLSILDARQNFIHLLQAGIDGAVEQLFFLFQFSHDKGAIAFQFWVIRLIFVHNTFC